MSLWAVLEVLYEITQANASSASSFNLTNLWPKLALLNTNFQLAQVRVKFAFHCDFNHSSETT